jgi:hypothetical protein
LSYPRPTECVGFDDISTGFQIGLQLKECQHARGGTFQFEKCKRRNLLNGTNRVDVVDDFRLSNAEQIVIAFQILGMLEEFLAPEIGFFQLVPLDHRAHSTVDD